MPPASPAPVAGLGARGLAALDRKLTVLASFSFLAHFGLAGSLYGDWNDPVTAEAERLATLVEDLRALPAPPIEHAERPAPVPPGLAADIDAPSPPRGTGHEGPRPGPAGGHGPVRSGPDGRIGERPSARLAAELHALDGQLAAALRGSGHATDRVLDRADMPVHLLEEIGRPSAAGEAGLAGALHLGGAPGVVLRPGTQPGALPGERMAYNDQPSLGALPEVKKPGGGSVPGTAPTTFICRYPAPPRPRVPAFALRACYQRGLEEDPTMRGSLRVNVTLRGDGTVAGVTSAGVLGLSPTVVACVLAQIRTLSFAPGGDEGTVLTIPIAFSR